MTSQLWDESIVFAVALFIGYALHPVINSILIHIVGSILNRMDSFNEKINEYRRNGRKHKDSNKDK